VILAQKVRITDRWF